jgi:hypothetical protein
LGEISGEASVSRDVIWTVPREVGRKLQTDAVSASNLIGAHQQ